MKIALELSSTQSPAHQSRLKYAFQLFCAIYDHIPLLETKDHESADLRITYSRDETMRSDLKVLRLYSGYSPRPITAPAPPPSLFSRDNVKTVLFFPPEGSVEADWLAEIFEWTSCADEYSISARDSVGRVPFQKSVFGRYDL